MTHLFSNTATTFWCWKFNCTNVLWVFAFVSFIICSSLVSIFLYIFDCIAKKKIIHCWHGMIKIVFPFRCFFCSNYICFAAASASRSNSEHWPNSVICSLHTSNRHDFVRSVTFCINVEFIVKIHFSFNFCTCFTK